MTLYSVLSVFRARICQLQTRFFLAGRVRLPLFFAILVLMSGFPRVTPAFADDVVPPIVLVSSHHESEYFGMLAKLIYEDAFARLGRPLVIRFAPLKRAEALHEKGLVDGDVGRTDAFQNRFPNMIRVRESTISVRYSAYSLLPTLRVEGWYSLRWRALRIEHLRGDLLSVSRLRNIGPSAQVRVVDNWQVGVRKLFAKRTDLFIGMDRGVDYALTLPEFEGRTLHRAGFLELSEAHAYLQPQHWDLAIALSEVLGTMKKEGVIERYEKLAFQMLGQ